MSQCRRCDAQILWAKTLNDRRIPINPEPVEDGNIELEQGPAGLIATVLSNKQLAGRLPMAELYVTHFVTCPGAAEFRT